MTIETWGDIIALMAGIILALALFDLFGPRRKP